MPDETRTAETQAAEAQASVATCMQTVITGGDCCTSWKETCGAPAVWQRAESGVRLCDEHLGNARKLGGAKLGYWVIADTRVPYPDGWTRIEDGAELIDELPRDLGAPRDAPDPKVRPSGLVLP